MNMPHRVLRTSLLLSFMFATALNPSPFTVAAEPKGTAPTKVPTTPSLAKSSDEKKPVGNARAKELNEQGVKAVNQQRFDDAENFFRQSLGLDPGNLTAVFNLASVYLQNKKERAAIDLLTKYVQLAPDDIGLAIRLGDAYFASRDPRRAREAYEAAFTKAPKYPGLAAKIASCALATKDFKEAEVFLRRASELEPKNSEVLTNLASILLANGKPRDAIAVAKRAIQLTSTSELYLVLGNSYELLKDKQNAVIAYERARDLGDVSPELREKIEALR